MAQALNSPPYNATKLERIYVRWLKQQYTQE